MRIEMPGSGARAAPRNAFDHRYGVFLQHKRSATSGTEIPEQADPHHHSIRTGRQQ
jgi:hypothetical protein